MFIQLQISHKSIMRNRLRLGGAPLAWVLRGLTCTLPPWENGTQAGSGHTCRPSLPVCSYIGHSCRTACWGNLTCKKRVNHPACPQYYTSKKKKIGSLEQRLEPNMQSLDGYRGKRWHFKSEFSQNQTPVWTSILKTLTGHSVPSGELDTRPVPPLWESTGSLGVAPRT